jgi:hypothetical protein
VSVEMTNHHFLVSLVQHPSVFPVLHGQVHLVSQLQLVPQTADVQEQSKKKTRIKRKIILFVFFNALFL